MKNVIVVIDKIGSSNLTLRLYSDSYKRSVPFYKCGKVENDEIFIKNELEEFISEIKNYPNKYGKTIEI